MKQLINLCIACIALLLLSCNSNNDNNGTQANSNSNQTSDNCSKYVGIWTAGESTLQIKENGNSFIVRYERVRTSGGGMNLTQKEGFNCICQNGVLQDGKGEIFGYNNGSVSFRGGVFTK